MAKNLLGLVLALGLALSAPAVLAQRSSPSWSQLPPDQQRILAPIQGEWDKLDGQRKRKWIGVAQRYPKMSPDEQERLQRRMKEWAGLTSEQRQAVREKYREFEQLPPDERQAMRDKWERFKEEQAARETGRKVADEEGERSAQASDDAPEAPEGVAAATEPTAEEAGRTQ
jgi:membrane protein involved in colicin uptake